MNILLLGNGFDLSFDLPTGYKDFIRIVNYLIEHEDQLPDKISSVLDQFKKKTEYAGDLLLDPDKLQKIVAHARDNLWFKYFNNKLEHEQIIHGDKSWIDFEGDLCYICRLFDEFFNLPNNYNYMTDGIIYTLPKAKSVEYCRMCYLIQSFGCFFDGGYFEGITSIQLSNKYTKNALLDASHIRLIDKKSIVQTLYSSFKELSVILCLYLKMFVEIPLAQNPNSFSNNVDYHRTDYVLTFNYTNTYEKIVSSKIKVLHLHGNVDENIVLGYNSDEDDCIPTNTLWLDFKKYYQRVFWRTDEKFVHFNNFMRTSKEPVELAIVGFSLSRNDEDIIRMIFESATKITIFCHDEQAKHDYIHNLVGIYGKTMFDELIYKKQMSFLTGHDELLKYFNYAKNDFL